MTLFFFNDTATTEIYALSLHDALPIFSLESGVNGNGTLVIGGTLDNSGTVTLTTTHSNAIVTSLGSATAVINNLGGGVFNVNAGTNNGSRTVTGDFNNAGIVNVNLDTTFSIGTTDLDNAA